VLLFLAAMSFGDLESGRRTKQWSGEESSFEHSIRANIQALQESIRCANSQLDLSQRSYASRRISNSFNASLEKGQELVEETEQLVRDWTVHLAGEPAVRHKKKLSYEKLQKAFREEVDNLKVAQRRAVTVRQEAEAAGGHHSAFASVECRGMCEDQVSSLSDEEHCLLATEEVDVVDQDVALQNRITQEREEGIKRIQSQVTEVSQMFRDLASIVSDQGHQFETIEQQAESASSNSMLAVKELKKSSDRKRSQSERLCCMLMTAMLVLCFVVATHMPHLHSSHSGGV